jgi:hypothetical protein
LAYCRAAAMTRQTSRSSVSPATCAAAMQQRLRRLGEQEKRYLSQLSDACTAGETDAQRDLA